MARPVTAAPLAELEAFLAANRQVQFLDAWVTGLAGVARGIRLRRHEFAAAFTEGRALPGSLLSVDITGLDIGDDGMVWKDGDADRLAWPVAGTLALAPWLSSDSAPDSAEVMLALHGRDGEPCANDPRAILARVLGRFAADGLTPVLACELEFYLIDQRRADDGGIRLAAGADGRVAGHAGVHDLEPDGIAGPFLRDLWAACDTMGVPAGAAISEYAPGQHEVTLAHRADALTACDDAIRFKRVAKGVAAKHARTATFMAKPFADEPGSGLHLHISVNDAGGCNIFASPDGAPNAALRHALGGAVALLAESVAVFAPNANSYRRFRPATQGAPRAGWGIDTRIVPLRVPAGADASRRIEHRVAGADANPYLAAAAALAAIHHGLTQRLDPGEPLTRAGLDTGERLPSDWGYATERFARSAVLADYWGAEAVETFAALKRIEQERYNSVVTALDYDWVLRSA